MRVNRLPLATMQSNAAQARVTKGIEAKSRHNAHLQNGSSQSNCPAEIFGRDHNLTKQWSIRDFDIGKKLGRGKFGRVLLVRIKKNGFVCALKMMKKEELVKYHAEVQFRREVEIQASLHHPNILQIYGYFEDARKVYIMVEYVPKGELYTHLGELGRFPPALASNYIVQVASGLNYCHQKSIMHRDIKPENLLLSNDGQVKISDFGWSIRTRHKRGTLCGTLDYLPPEMILKEAHSHQVDTWALGVLTYEFLVGEAPFFAEGRQKTYEKIQKVALEFPNYVEPEAEAFVRALLQKDPSRRLPLEDVPSHPWMLKHRQNWPRMPE